MILLGGGPGTGKSRLGRTMAEQLDSEMSVEHISIGDRVRKIALGRDAVKSAHRQAIIDHLNSDTPHAPLPDEIIHDVVDDALQQHEARETILLDGFPRYKTQMTHLDGLFDEGDRVLRGLILTTVHDDIALRRLVKRTGERDINEELARERIAEHKKHYHPVVRKLDNCGLPIAKIDTSGEDKNETTQRGLQVVRRMLGRVATKS